MSKKQETATPQLPATESSQNESAQSEGDKKFYIMALQSDRINVLVGITKKSFVVPQELLIQHSPIFRRMCTSAVRESVERTIELPDVDSSTFENFILWIHEYEPKINSKSCEEVVKLAILAETYIIYHLKNQTSNTIRTRIFNEEWKNTPNTVSLIYRSVPNGSILQQLCVSGFAIALANTYYDGARSNKCKDYSKWKTVFEELPTFGWDYFKAIQNCNQTGQYINGGPCSYHDHSNIPGWEMNTSHICKFPHKFSAPVQGDEIEPEEA